MLIWGLTLPQREQPTWKLSPTGDDESQQLPAKEHSHDRHAGP
jgi:hypothetical protein